MSNKSEPRVRATSTTRLNKFIADSGIASRRDADKLIQSGRVSVNGVVINALGSTISESDVVSIDGNVLSKRNEVILVAFHKPINTVVSTRDPEGRKTIYDVLPPEYKNLKYVGRLDYKTTGLLLLTNSGDLARKLTLPESNIPRTYLAECRFKGPQDFNSISRMLAPARRGMVIDGLKYRPMKISFKCNDKYIKSGRLKLEVVVTEGKKNEVRIVLDACGLPVLKLHRISYGRIELGTLPVGGVRREYEQRVRVTSSEYEPRHFSS